MRDKDLRKILHDQLKKDFSYDLSTKILDEFSISDGDTRVDVAAINGSIYGYEIKSEQDTLERLPHQIKLYNQVLDYIYIVTQSKHYGKIQKLIPDFWGVMLVNESEVQTIKKPSFNTSTDIEIIIKLLWKEELKELINENNIPIKKSVLYKSKFILRKIVIENIELQSLKDQIRTKLKLRPLWRVDSESFQYDDLLLQTSK